MKKCPFCAEKIQEEAIKCKHCGSFLENKKETKAEVLVSTPSVQNEDTEVNKDEVIYYSISPLKLIVLSALTLDLYYIYWFSRNWRIVKEHEKSNISSGLRGWLVIFFCYPLFKKIYESAKKNGYDKAYYPGVLATLFIILLLLGRSDEQSIWLLSYLNFIPMLAIQNVINFNNKQIDKTYKAESKFSVWEIVFSIIGGIFLIFILVGVFDKSSNNAHISVTNTSSSSTTSNNESLEGTLAEVATEINKDGPQMLDKITQLTGATSSGKELNYSYKLITSTRYSQLDLDKSLRSGIVNNVCQNSGMKSLLDLGAIFNYNYYDNQGRLFGKISVNSSDCK